jgi:hypothetical protein
LPVAQAQLNDGEKAENIKVFNNQRKKMDEIKKQG